MTSFDAAAFAVAMGGGPDGGGGMTSVIFLYVTIFAIFYLLVLGPQRQKAKKHEEMLSALKKGDEVITAGGIHGKVHGVTEQVVTIEVAPNVRIKVSRSRVEGVVGGDAASGSAKS